MDKKLIIGLVVVAALLGIGYYVGFDIGWEGAVRTTGPEAPAAPEVAVEPVVFGAGNRGYLAQPVAPGIYPGVVMIHEWWGLNENIKGMARELAAEGYRVLAVDLYGGRVAETADEARELSGGINQTAATRALRDAAGYLRARGAPKVASLGWCFGGGQSLQLALSGEPLDATVIYYGRLVTDPTELEAISWPVLGIFGETDTSIPVATVNEFGAALSSLGIENRINIYPGVGHAFANPTGQNYAPAETADAWAKTLSFLASALK